MLKLKKVELQGFKSFCDRTELRFRGDGIAAVVGPNGCGKSNLSDAISWVLGEQSAKSLRGARMEDVIFAGTRERKPVGMASVTMTMIDPAAGKPVEAPEPPVEVQVTELTENGSSNGNGHATANGNGTNGHHTHSQILPRQVVTPGEITITRRLFRSGESEYLINGRPARLRDIQDLFMGSGLGPESYAIIEQGRIGQILSSRPSDRRAIIEEAAGVTRFKTRKRLAEAKLEGARQNLARVFDILEEVTRQANSLKRQAQRTKRYEELKSDLDSRLRTLLSARSQQLTRDAARAAEELTAASAELAQINSGLTAGDQLRAELQTSVYALSARLQEQQKSLADLNVELERTRGRLASQVRESADLESRMTRHETETEDLEKRADHSTGEAATLRAAVDELQSQIAALRAQLVQKNQARESLQQNLREKEQKIESGRVLVLRLLGEASTLRNQLAQIDEFLAGIDRESQRVTREEQAAAADSDRLAAAREKLSFDLGRQQLELESITGERRQTELDLAERKRKSAELRQTIDQLRAETSRVRARKESIENVLAHHSYTTETVKRLLAQFEKSGALKPEGVLADFIEVESHLERAAEEFLHQELEFVVVRDWAQAERGMQVLRADLEGRATFLVEDKGDQPATADPALHLPRLADQVRFTNGLTGETAALLPRLAHCYIAPDADEARALAARHPQLSFLVEDGRCYQGRTLTGGRKKSSGPLALKREVRELASDLTAKERTLSIHAQTLEEITREITALEADLDRLRQTQQAREKDAVALQAEQRKLAEEFNRAQNRISVARMELERLTREQERSTARRAENLDLVARKESDRAARESELESARADLESVNTECQRVREEHSAIRAALAGLEERHRAQISARDRIENQLREMASRRQNLAHEIERLGEHRSRLLADNIELDQRANTLSEQVLHLEAEVAQLGAGEAERRTELAAREDNLKSLRTLLEQAHARDSQARISVTRLESELRFLGETSEKELGIPLAELPAPEHPLDPEALAEIERLYKEVKSKIENLGPINPTALEEFEAATQRQEFLTAQRKDLLDSIRDTEKAIAEIDAVSKQRFLEAFEAINKNFKECFTTLFGGGTGEMRLTDADNAGESGIDIVASPPGKKLQNVLLLSGGEKAMAALALLMSIFRYQPSPFCVLDEVDAPLDEANIARLTRLLREMSLDTQFIVITHSKKTMESAQSMYGVTMQEAGVSKLVSVKFHGDRDPAPTQVAVA